MRTALAVGVVCGLLAATGAWSEPPPGMPGPDPQDTKETKETKDTKPTAATGDAEIISKLVAINQHEINTAKLAEKKKLSPRVQEFAQMMREEHDRNLRDTQDLARRIGVSPRDTAQVSDMKKKSSAELKSLKSLDGEQFETKFIESMVSGHEAVLRELDTSIAAAQNADLKQHLQTTRERVAMHLAEAQRLENAAASARK